MGGQRASDATWVIIMLVSGSLPAIALGVITFQLLQQNLFAFQSSFAATVGPSLIFGYPAFPLIIFPAVAAAFLWMVRRSTRGFWYFFAGSAFFGIIFTALIWLYLFTGFVVSGPP